MTALTCLAIGFILGFTFGMRIASVMMESMRVNLTQFQHQAAELGVVDPLLAEPPSLATAYEGFRRYPLPTQRATEEAQP